MGLKGLELVHSCRVRYHERVDVRPVITMCTRSWSAQMLLIILQHVPVSFQAAADQHACTGMNSQDGYFFIHQEATTCSMQWHLTDVHPD